MRHGFWISPKEEQHRDAKEKRMQETLRFLASIRPVTGRVLESRE